MNDIQQERRVRQEHRTESLKALHDGISTRRYVCQSLVGIISLYNKVSQWQHEMPDYVNNNNIRRTRYLATTIRSTRYQVSRRKKDGKKEKKNWKNEKRFKNKHACVQVAGGVRRGQGRCLLVIRSVLWCVQLMDNRRTKKKARQTQPRWGQRQSRKKTRRVDRTELVGFRWVWICAWCFEVIWCVWHRTIYRDIMSRTMRCHKISVYRDIVYISRIFGTDMEISYPVD